jgi:galactokinase
MTAPIADAPLDIDRIADAFATRFQSTPRLFRAPGRINIIGEHTDYNDGFALPAAIDRQCVAAIAPNRIGAIRVVSLTMEQEATLSATTFTRAGAWSDYVGAVAAAVRSTGVDTPGFDLVISSDVPLGGGVSSSAALEVAVALGMLTWAGAAATSAAFARIAWDAEFTHVGAPCGPMDQFASVNGVAGHALLLDCRSLTAQRIRLPEEAVFLIIDSGVRHQIVDGGYRERRSACEAAAAHLGVKSLRETPLATLDAAHLPDILYRRARHVLCENERTLAAADTLSRGDLREAGRLMALSHASLRDDFHVTCAQTDLLADIANTAAGVYGARQMGGGFGGCVIALATRDHGAAACENIVETYSARAGRDVTGYVCATVDGAGEITR